MGGKSILICEIPSWKPKVSRASILYLLFPTPASIPFKSAIKRSSSKEDLLPPWPPYSCQCLHNFFLRPRNTTFSEKRKKGRHCCNHHIPLQIHNNWLQNAHLLSQNIRLFQHHKNTHTLPASSERASTHSVDKGKIWCVENCRKGEGKHHQLLIH